MTNSSRLAHEIFSNLRAKLKDSELRSVVLIAVIAVCCLILMSLRLNLGYFIDPDFECFVQAAPIRNTQVRVVVVASIVCLKVKFFGNAMRSKVKLNFFLSVNHSKD